MIFKFKNTIYIACFLFFTNYANAQDAFQSNLQMMFQPNMNFSAASSFEGSNLALYHRNQWVSFKGAPKVFGANLFTSINQSTVGISFFQDNVGIHKNSEINFNYAYLLKVSKKMRLSFSLSPSLIQKKSDYSSLTAISQDDDLLSTSTMYSIFTPNARFGVYLYSKKFYLGFSTPNAIDNNIVNSSSIQTSFNPSTVNYYLHGGYKYVINKKNNILASAYLKTTKGSFLHTEINLMWETLESKLGVGVSYKTSKEAVAIIKLKPIKNFTLAYAFQYSLSDLQKYNKGSHEILLIYNIFPIERVKLTAPRF